MKYKKSFGLLIVVAFVVLVNSSFMQKNNVKVTLPPKMSMYVGSSYHVLYGNPKNQYGLDPGFYHPVFEFSYQKNKTTEDGKFSIPDQTTSHKMSTCSFSSEISAFRGTQSYQNDLTKSAQFTVGSLKFLGWSFSLSRSWQKVYNTTTVQKMSLTHATAECQAYEIILDRFALPALSNNFITGALSSYSSGNWDNFISEFGTHYVQQTTMGGRATQQISYTFDSFSKMESLDVDLNIAAKASFAKFFADATFDWNKYSKSINYSQKISTSKNELYIGGQPPRTGNIYDWQVKIVDNPMPITYKLTPLSDLFQKITSLKFNKTKAVTQFTESLQKLCDKLHCGTISPDFAKPFPAYVVFQKTQVYGLANGNDFQSYVNSTTMELRRVLVKVNGGEVLNLQLFLSDGVAQLYTQAAGSVGTNTTTWVVPEGQYVTQIQCRSADRIIALTFITNKGNKSPQFGSDGGTYHLVNIPQDYRIVGFYGTQGNSVYKLGFMLAKTIYPSSPTFNANHQKMELILQ